MVTTPHGLRVIPVSDRAWLIAALGDALAGGAPIRPVDDTKISDSARSDTSPGFETSTDEAELPEGTAVVIRTSGSSGVPKSVALSAAALRASAESTHERLGGPGQWLVALPSQLISGLQMLVRSAVAGTSPVFFDGPFDAAALIEAAESMTHERRYVSLVPFQLARLLDLAERDGDAADALRRFDAVLVGGQAVTLELRRRAHALGVALKRSYGMSETAGGCVYDGVEIGDTLVRIRGGEVQLSGPTLALGYVGDAALTSKHFITDPSGERWYRTGDAGELLGGMLTVTGRLDRVIISGGINVSLDEVERVVRALPGWGDAVALGVPDRDWGQRVHLVRATTAGTADAADSVGLGSVGSPGAALIAAAGVMSAGALAVGNLAAEDTPAGETSTSFTDAGEAIRAALGVAAAPVGESIVDEIPLVAGGKPDLAALAQRAGLKSAVPAPAAPTPAASATQSKHTKEQA